MKIQYLTCTLLILVFNCTLSAQVTTSKPLTKTDVLAFNKSETEYLQVQKELQQLEQKKKQLLDLMDAFNEQQKKLAVRVEKLETGYNAIGNASTVNREVTGNPQSPTLLNATKQLQEIQMSFNLQYLQLQSQMQHENRSYTAVSNIMKTKHDTVKNSISNIR